MAFVKKLTLQPRIGQSGCELNFDEHGLLLPYDPEHTWSADDLRLELQVLLVGNEIAPADWFRTWDTDNSLALSKKEFAANTRKLFLFGDRGEGPRLWEAHVKKTVDTVFTKLSGEDQLLDVSEFEGWLSLNWPGMPRALKIRKHTVLSDTPEGGESPKTTKTSKRGAKGGKAGEEEGSASRRSRTVETKNMRIVREQLGVTNRSSNNLLRAAAALGDELRGALREMEERQRGRKKRPTRPDATKTGGVANAAPAPDGPRVQLKPRVDSSPTTRVQQQRPKASLLVPTRPRSPGRGSSPPVDRPTSASLGQRTTPDELVRLRSGGPLHSPLHDPATMHGQWDGARHPALTPSKLTATPTPSRPRGLSRAKSSLDFSRQFPSRTEATTSSGAPSVYLLEPAARTERFSSTVFSSVDWDAPWGWDTSGSRAKALPARTLFPKQVCALPASQSFHDLR